MMDEVKKASAVVAVTGASVAYLAAAYVNIQIDTVVELAMHIMYSDCKITNITKFIIQVATSILSVPAIIVVKMQF